MRPWDSGSADYQAWADRSAIEAPERSGFLDNVFAQHDAQRAINGSAEHRVWTYGGTAIEDRSRKLEEITGIPARDWSLDTAYAGPWMDDGEWSPSRRRTQLLGLIRSGKIRRAGPGLMQADPDAAGFLEGNEDYAERLSLLENAIKARPGEIQSDQDIERTIVSGILDAQQRASMIAAGRPEASGSAARFLGMASGGTANVIEALGTAGPLALVAGGGARAGASLLERVGRTAAVEGGIGLATEIPVQVEAFRFNNRIGIPYSGKEAALNVLAATLGGAVIGGAIPLGAAGARLTADHARAVAGRVRERFAAKPELHTPEAEGHVRVLEDYVADADSAPSVEVEAAHSAAIGKAQDDLEAGRPVSVERLSEPVRAASSQADRVDALPGRRALTRDDVETFDPRGMEVDAQLFQFKTGGDEFGVTAKLKDVQTFDAGLAGTVVAWERADGKLFIVDGHQRMGIARRSIEGGQDPQTVFLTGYRLRETDGWTPGDARAQAAFKNISEGTGTALDAAKLIRNTPPEVLRHMPELSANNALMRNGRNLSKLDDDAFGAVVNEVVPEDYGAIVGELIQRGPEQMAALDVLARAGAPNAQEARFIVEQVRQAQFVRGTEQGGLFGAEDFAKSLFPERARILSRALATVRNDIKTFGTLVRREGQIAGAGNRLKREANLARKEADEQIVAEIERLANVSGPISNALGDAARELAEGGKLAGSVESFLGAVRSEADRLGKAGPRAGGGQPGADAKVGAGAVVEPAAAAPAEKVSLETTDDADLFAAARKRADLFDEGEAARLIAQADELVAANPDAVLVLADEHGGTRAVRVADIIAEMDAEARGIDDVAKCSFPGGL